MKEKDRRTILILTNTSGGLYLFRKELILRLMKNHSIVVVTSDTGRVDELKNLGCKVKLIDFDRRGMNPIKDYKLLRKYYSIIRSLRPKLVITYTIKANIYGGLCSRFCRVKYVANITGLGSIFERSDAIKTMAVLLYRRALKKAETVFFENSSNMSYFISNRIIEERQACLLNGAGVNLDHFSMSEYPDYDGVFRFLFIGRIMKEKGIEELLNVVEKLHQNGYRIILEIVGDYEEDYRKVIDTYEIKGFIKYHGKQKDVRPYIKDAHCFVLPSWHEGMANTNLESAAMGRPVITSNIPGCKESVLDELSGYLCEPKNEESLYRAMEKMILVSNEDRKQMGITGRRHMEAHFSKKSVVDKTVNHLGILI